jgi:chaperone modulatory protein CbpM
MIRIDVLLIRFTSLDRSQIADWVARGWVRAEGSGPTDWLFADIDVARLQLLRELSVDLALDEEAIPVVLSLLDQVYSLRRALRTVMDIVNEAPENTQMRSRIAAALTREM